jgi:Indole-3-glycerol phosphate synthase
VSLRPPLVVQDGLTVDAGALRYERSMANRRFSHAIAEGDGISVVAAVEDAESARAAEEQRAEALVVRGDPAAVREGTTLPILWRASVPLERAAEVADAVMLVFDSLEDEDGRLETLHAQALELGLDCAVEVRNEEELEQALERVDPEILLLSPVEAADSEETALEYVLDLLAAVPAGKLAIADLDVTTADEVSELERAGVDAVIVHTRDVSPLAGGPPPEV